MWFGVCGDLNFNVFLCIKVSLVFVISGPEFFLFPKIKIYIVLHQIVKIRKETFNIICRFPYHLRKNIFTR